MTSKQISGYTFAISGDKVSVKRGGKSFIEGKASKVLAFFERNYNHGVFVPMYEQIAAFIKENTNL